MKSTLRLAVVCTLLLSSVGMATVLVAVDLEDLAEQAQVIVVGEVNQISSDWTTHSDRTGMRAQAMAMDRTVTRRGAPSCRLLNVGLGARTCWPCSSVSGAKRWTPAVAVCFQ